MADGSVILLKTVYVTRKSNQDQSYGFHGKWTWQTEIYILVSESLMHETER